VSYIGKLYGNDGAPNPFPLGLRQNGAIFVDSGDIYHPTSQHWRNIRRLIILHSVNSANPWGMM
jgi:hypothetical protein